MFRDESPAAGSPAPGGDVPQSGTTAEIDVSAMGEEKPSRRMTPRTTMLLSAGFVVLLLLSGGGALLLATSGSGASEAELTGEGVADESNDSEPLRSGNLFPETVDAGGEEYSLVIDDDTDDCATAAQGGYGEQLEENECRQIVRASYTSEETNRAVTVGVAAMSTADNAQAAQEAQDLGSSWFAGLNGEQGSGTERMRYASGQGSGAQWGRYLIFALAANNDGRAAPRDAEKLTTLSDDFVEVPFDSLSERAQE
ncbi:hypothetical protein FHX37_3009 [Haloactinospora alba]|uniref:PknH-like protein n=1 Tax=Haloactinospora alba TaxID=405555 RepID=A0A543NMF9_9ACTN|nr:hypothetical protein [Haloactinospora alba]TQN33015.1 hypothetical protein FHX37_3009 [Haloactinospora alba]